MIDTKLLRKETKLIAENLHKRGFIFEIKKWNQLETKRKELQKFNEEQQSKLNEISKEIGIKKNNSIDSSDLQKQAKDLTTKIKDQTKELEKLLNEIDEFILSLPNLIDKDVPVGKDETDNLELRKVGNPREFSFSPMDHLEIGGNRIDMELGAKITGSRFKVLKQDIALLQRALISFMIDTHVNKNNYLEISPPLIANENTMYGTGQLPKFENDQFELVLEDKNDRKFLIPTAEVILTNMVKDQILDIKDLPLRFVASTPCFRKEAGSYGKDTKGMIRQHQFYKVELVSIVEPNHCIEELERMTNCATDILDQLKLPYRKVLLCTGDMGFSAEKTYDIEVWIPSEKKYREISSCSSCGSFQARRMKARYKNSKKETNFVGTLNGSGLAVGRTLIAVIENYQQADGSIIIPEVLKPYMNNLEKIDNN